MAKQLITLLALLFLTLSTAESVVANVVIKTIAISGDPAPYGDGVFSGFGTPILNNVGQVAFSGSVTNTPGEVNDKSGIFRGESKGDLIRIALAGDPAPSGTGSLAALGNPDINDAGQVAFFGNLDGTSTGRGIRSILIGDGTSGPTSIVHTGQAAPDGNGTFADFWYFSLNDNGQTAFHSVLADTSGGTHDNLGVFLGDDSVTPKRIARRGQTVPGGNGKFLDFNQPDINNLGQVAFHSQLTDTTNSFNDNVGIFRGNGNDDLTQVARTGQESPEGGRLSHLDYFPLQSNQGQTVFSGSFAGTFDTNVTYVSNETNDLTTILSGRQILPRSDLSFANSGAEPDINDVSQVVSSGVIINANNTVHPAIVRSDVLGNVSLIAQAGKSSPDNNGIFRSFDSFATLNEAGQVAFAGTLSGTHEGFDDDIGIYLHDDQLGLVQVIRKGEKFHNSIITNLDFNYWRTSIRRTRRSFNDSGQITFKFWLADGRSGIAIATIIPEPSTLLLLAVASSTLLFRQRRRPLAL